MANNSETIKLIAQQAAVVGGSYVLSRWMGIKIAEKMTKPTEEPGGAEVKRAFASIGLAGLSIFMYDKIDDKLIAGGLIAGTGLNAVSETLKIPKIKSNLPAAFQNFLGSDSSPVATTQGEVGSNYLPYSQKQILDMVSQKIEEAQVAGYLGQNQQQSFDNVHALPVLTVQGEVGTKDDPTFSGKGTVEDLTFSGDDDEFGNDYDFFGSDEGLDGDDVFV